MAAADYYLCDACNAKAFYDTDVNYDRVGDMACICQECAKTHAVRVVRTEEQATSSAKPPAEASPVQRFNNRAGLMNPESNGLYVRYEDHAALATAQPTAEASDLRKALQMAVLQNSHDMLMTGDELRQCQRALATQVQLAGASNGYVQAFYELGKLMGLSAQPISPETVWREQMLPKLNALLATSGPAGQSPDDTPHE